MQTGIEPSVKTAANITKSVVYNNRDNLMAGLIVAGYDKSKGGQVILIFFKTKSFLLFKFSSLKGFCSSIRWYDC
jgi:hypothetical protein